MSYNTDSLAQILAAETTRDTTTEHSNLTQSPMVSADKGDTEIENATSDIKLIDQVGQLTRILHNTLCELGYDKRVESIASKVPYAQDKLSYVAFKTEQAAERALNATETAMPIQDKLSADAINLSAQWKQALETQQSIHPDTETFKALLIQTLSYLDQVPQQTAATNTQLMEILMAQDFQDLTGQVIKKVTQMVQSLEQELVSLLLVHSTTNRDNHTEDGLLNGPVVNPKKRSDTVNDQDQVDDLLASLGF
tara:strand:+ start:297 stop:1052 length:756 start_codon:yes stop_codon:yes gene_type:complete